MRSIAVVLVFIDHASLFAGTTVFHGWNLRWLGVFGVYLFFVHTCLVLMWSLERRPHTLDFYVRRIFRIYPLAIVAVLTVVLLHVPLFPRAELGPRMLAANLLLVQNLCRYPLVMGTLWSLPLEVQMYLLLPVLFLFARRERTLWPFLIMWVLACLLARSIPAVGIVNVFYSVIPHFLPGVIAYVGFKRWKERLPSAAFFGVLLILLVYFEGKPSVHRGWIVCLALGLLLPLFRDIRSRLLLIPGHTVATYSYGIYLLHLPCLYAAFMLASAYNVWVRVLLALLWTAGGSWLAYHLVERPMIQLGARVAVKMQRRFGTSTDPGYGLDLV